MFVISLVSLLEKDFLLILQEHVFMTPTKMVIIWILLSGSSFLGNCLGRGKSGQRVGLCWAPILTVWPWIFLVPAPPHLCLKTAPSPADQIVGTWHMGTGVEMGQGGWEAHLLRLQFHFVVLVERRDLHPLRPGIGSRTRRGGPPNPPTASPNDMGKKIHFPHVRFCVAGGRMSRWHKPISSKPKRWISLCTVGEVYCTDVGCKPRALFVPSH